MIFPGHYGEGSTLPHTHFQGTSSSIQLSPSEVSLVSLKWWGMRKGFPVDQKTERCSFSLLLSYVSLRHSPLTGIISEPYPTNSFLLQTAGRGCALGFSCSLLVACYSDFVWFSAWSRKFTPYVAVESTAPAHVKVRGGTVQWPLCLNWVDVFRTLKAMTLLVCLWKNSNNTLVGWELISSGHRVWTWLFL